MYACFWHTNAYSRMFLFQIYQTNTNDDMIEESFNNEVNAVDKIKRTLTKSEKKKESNMVSVNADLLSDIFQISVDGENKLVKMYQLIISTIIK